MMRILCALLVSVNSAITTNGFSLSGLQFRCATPRDLSQDTSAGFSWPLLAAAVVNGAINSNKGARSFAQLEAISNISAVNEADLLPEAPALSYSKYLTMQEKRVVATVRYSEDAGLRPYFLTVAKNLKQSHPDVVIERLILPKSPIALGTFEVLVDGKVVVGKGSSKMRGNNKGTYMSVYVSMEELDLAISRARRKLRPTTVYGDEGEPNQKRRQE